MPEPKLLAVSDLHIVHPENRALTETLQPTQILRYPDFAQWCGTVLTADWHVRFRARAVVYGHLHIPRVTWHDGVRFEEVSVGYPREWKSRPPREPLRQILPQPGYGPMVAS